MTATPRSKSTMVLNTQNEQTLTLVSDGDTITVRIAKAGHNRGIAKLSNADGEAILAFLLENT